jgi:hypothetical protein
VWANCAPKVEIMWFKMAILLNFCLKRETIDRLRRK